MKTESPRFLRARQPEQIEERREAILQAALNLLIERDLENVSLTDIASKAGIAKSNLYRYFESREHIYLIVLQREGIAWEKKTLAALAELNGRGTIDQVANLLTLSFDKADKYCSLMSVINSVLEKNLSPELVANFRLVFFERRERLAVAIAASLPGVETSQVSPLILPIFAYVAGLWPLSHPDAGCKTILAKAEYKHLQISFSEHMRHFIQMLFKGVSIAERGGPGV